MVVCVRQKRVEYLKDNRAMLLRNTSGGWGIPNVRFPDCLPTGGGWTSWSRTSVIASPWGRPWIRALCSGVIILQSSENKILIVVYCEILRSKLEGTHSTTVARRRGRLLARQCCDSSAKGKLLQRLVFSTTVVCSFGAFCFDVQSFGALAFRHGFSVQLKIVGAKRMVF